MRGSFPARSGSMRRLARSLRWLLASAVLFAATPAQAVALADVAESVATGQGGPPKQRPAEPAKRLARSTPPAARSTLARVEPFEPRPGLPPLRHGARLFLLHRALRH